MLFDRAKALTLSDFDYELPEELIAQHPTAKRDGSKLLVMDAQSGEVVHSKFSNVVDSLKSGDVLVLNNTKVFPSRLFARKDKTAYIILSFFGTCWFGVTQLLIQSLNVCMLEGLPVYHGQSLPGSLP